MLWNLSKGTALPKGVDIELDCTSRSEDPRIARDLSPFFLGPLTINGLECKNFENAWQYSKVYDQHVKKERIQDVYYKWRALGYANPKAVRYPMSKDSVPLYSLLGNRKLSYVEARQEIYIPEYAKLVRKTKSFKWLKEQHAKGANIVLRDFDGYNHHSMHRSYRDVITDPNRKMGHGFVICMLLEMPSLLKMYRTN